MELELILGHEKHSADSKSSISVLVVAVVVLDHHLQGNLEAEHLEISIVFEDPE